MPDPYRLSPHAESYKPDQLVVDIRDRSLVVEKLKNLKIYCLNETPSDLLDLVRLDLPDLSGAEVAFSTELTRAQLIEKVQEDCASIYASGMEPSDLDLLIYALRYHFRTTCDGFEPIIGKVRLVHDVNASPHIGGEGFPEPADEADLTLKDNTAVLGRRIRVGLLDTAFYPHPKLAGRVLADSKELIPDSHSRLSSDPLNAAQGHATFLAGVILQEAPNAEVIVRSVLDELGTASSWDVAEKMVAFRNDVDILNMSFSCVTADRQPPLVLARAVERLSPQVVLVAAAGNHGDRPEPGIGQAGEITSVTPSWPAAFAEVIAVGATDGKGKLASFSPDAPWIRRLAVGVGVASTYLEGFVRFRRLQSNGSFKDHGQGEFKEPYAKWNGTSAAAAKVSGKIAELAAKEQITAREAESRLPKP